MKASTVKNTLMMTLGTASSAFAASGGREDNSGIFVWIFLGFCALIVVVQVVPALLLFFGLAKGLSKNKAAEPETVKSR
ncbi:MAG: hypothetical protein GJV46_02445 [Geobacter sp.]|nr:hypothetical protein [Geobacter sp.]